MRENEPAPRGCKVIVSLQEVGEPVITNTILADLNAGKIDREDP